MKFLREETVFEACRRYFRVERRDLVYLKFITEAYEGMSTLSTVEKSTAVVSLTYQPCFSEDMEALIGALSKEITLTETQWPPVQAEQPGGEGTHHA